MPFEGGTFDRALALLVLHFVPEAGKAVAEMRRVVRSGGVVAAAVWDHLGGMPGMRMMVDTVAALSESGRQLRGRYCFQPMMQPGEMKRTFVEQGLVDVTEMQLMIRMDYQSFDDYWAPIAAGEGPLGKYVAALDASERARTDAALRDAYEAGRPDGPSSFANVAWACRGIVPQPDGQRSVFSKPLMPKQFADRECRVSGFVTDPGEVSSGSHRSAMAP